MTTSFEDEMNGHLPGFFPTARPRPPGLRLAPIDVVDGPGWQGRPQVRAALEGLRLGPMPGLLAVRAHFVEPDILRLVVEIEVIHRDTGRATTIKSAGDVSCFELLEERATVPGVQTRIAERLRSQLVNGYALEIDERLRFEDGAHVRDPHAAQRGGR